MKDELPQKRLRERLAPSPVARVSRPRPLQACYSSLKKTENANKWRQFEGSVHPIRMPIGMNSSRELKQQRRRRLPKRHLKSEFPPPQTSSHLFQLVQLVNCWQNFLELNSKRLYQSSGKEKESRCLVFTSSTKREIRYFHDVVVQRRQWNCTKKGWWTCKVVVLTI